MPSYIRTRGEFAVNSFTAADQVSPSVSTFADGGFVVVWVTTDTAQDGHDQAIKGQRFDSNGAKVGAEFLVNGLAAGAQSTPEVATLANGNFIVTWVTNAGDHGSDGIKARLFSGSGEPIGAEFKVNLASGSHFTSNVSALANGGFVISWDDWNGFDMKAQIFDAGGARVGGVLTVNTRTSYAQEYGDIVGLEGGGFVATWRTTDGSDDGSGDSVKGQVFDAAGSKVGGEFLVNSHKANNQYAATVEALAGGGFVIVWESWDPAQDGSSSALKAQIFNASGAKVGGEFRVNTQGADMQRDPQATATPDGGFVVSWTDFSSSQDGSQSSIKAQAFDAAGAKVGGEMLVNTLTAGYQTLSDIDTLADGRLILTWASDGGDGRGRGIRAQILGTEAAPTLPNTAPIIISNGGADSVSLTHDEGVAAVTTVVASDDGEPSRLRYSIAGADAALFTIDAVTGLLAFKANPDHVEGGDSIYDLTVTASDGELTGSQSFQITLRHVNYVTIVSDGGYDYANISVDENQTAVTIVSAIDDDGVPLTYSITGGQDAGVFTIDSQTGELRFAAAPDFESPASQYGDNVYYVQVTASDGTRSDTQEIAVEVEDVEEPEGFAIISNGGGDSAEIAVEENGTAVTAVAAQGAAGAVTYEIAGGYDASYFIIDSQTGQLSFVDAPDFEAGEPGYGNYYYGHGNSYHVIVRASDGTSSDEQELYISVQNVDEAPEFRTYGGQPHVYEGALENSSAAAWVGAEDPDRHDVVTYGIEGGADAHLFQVDPHSGELTFKTAPDFERPADSNGDNFYEVTVAAYSGMLSATQSFTFRVEDRHEHVVITSDGGERDARLSVAEHETAVTVVAASGDDRISYEIAGGRDAHFFVIDPNSGRLDFAVAPDFEAKSDSNRDNVYEVTIRAGNGATYDLQTVIVTLQNVNEGVYIASGSAVSVLENGTAATAVKAVDMDGGPVSYAITGGADAAAFSIDSATGALSFVRPPNFEAPTDSGGNNVYDVRVTASDGVFSDSRSLSVKVTNQNEAPAIVSGGGGDRAAVAVSENSGDVLGLTAVDPDGTAPQFGISGGADSALFEIDPATGMLRFKALPDFEVARDSDGDNVYEVTVAATDGQNTDHQSVSVTVGNLNEGISIVSNGGGTSASLELNEGERAVATVAAHDPDGARITYSIVGGADAARFAIDAATGLLTLLDLPDYESPVDSGEDNFYSVVVSASDGELSASQAIQVMIKDVEEGVTIATGPNLSVNEDSAFVTRVTATDGDGDPVTYAIAGGADASHFTIDRETGDLSIRTSLDYEAPADSDSDNVYEVIVRASDGLLSDERQMSIRVNDVYDDAEIVSYGGADRVALTVTEGGGSPVADVDASLSALWGVRFAIGGGADAALFDIDPDTGELSFKYPLIPDFEAPSDSDADNVYDVVVTASRGTSVDSQAFSIRIANRNEDLWITSDGGGDAALSVKEGDRGVTTVKANDKDGNVPVYSILGGADAALFAIDSATGVLTFIAAPDHEAPGSAAGTNLYTVEVGASDGEFTARQTLRISVGNVNEGVAITSGGGAESIAVAVGENGLAVTTIAASDADRDPLTYSIAGGADASRFEIDSRTGALRFVQAPDYEAPGDSGANNVYDVLVSVTDGSFTDTQAVAVTVANVNEGVAITSNGGGDSAAVAAAENGIAAARVVAVDVDGGPVTYSIAGGADSARFTIDAATGVLAFVAAPDFEAPGDAGGNNVYDVVVWASDGSFTDTQALAIKVANVNEAPAITSNGGGSSGSVSVAENALAVTVVSAADPDGGTLSYSIVGGADASRFTIDARTGALQFAAAPDWELPADSDQDNVYAVVVRSSDGQLVDDQALSVTVTNIRDGNTVTGTSGGDSISATSVNAALRTSDEEDLVFGRDGHDSIQGMAGDDEIYGEGGNDTLVGGGGADKLYGGLGKDQFTYNALSDSAGASRDLIMDFSRSQGDKISLTAIDANSLVSSNQAFTFIGTSAFSNVAGQLRYETSAGVTTIFGDVNGDGLADLQIQLSGSIPLIASDFIL